MKRPLSVLVLLGLFIASYLQVNAQTFPYRSCDCAATVTAGDPTGPANNVFIQGESQASDLVVTDPTGTGTTDYAYVVTDPNGFILGLTEDGSYDFSSSPAGTYGFTGIAYNQTQITTVCGLLPVICNGPTPPPDPFCPMVQDPNFECTLGNFFSLIGLLGGGQATVPSVVHVVDSIVCVSSFAGFINVCLAVDEIPSYTVTVQGASSGNDECDGATTIDPFSENGPFDNSEATGAGIIDNCFAEGDFGGAGPSDDNSLWFTFVGDGQTWHFYTSPECNGIDLLTEGGYVDGGDTQMEVFSGDCSNLTSLGCSEDDIAYGATNQDGAGYFAGVTVATEAGVTYYIMVDGFDGAAGQFCLEAAENPCGFVELTSNDALEVCPADVVTISVNATTVDYGLTINGNTPQVAFYVLDPSTQDVVAIVGADDNLSMEVDGASPYGGLSQVVVIPVILSNVVASGGNTYPFIDEGCSSNIGAPIAVTYLSAAECTAAVPNDECVNAIELTVTDGAINGPFSNVGATGEEGVIPPACFGDAPSSGDNYYDNSVWFMFQGTGEQITLTTNIDGIDSTDANIDTQIGVYAVSCGGTEVACGDDIDGENYLSTVTLQTEVGVTYYVVVDGYYYNSLGGGAAGQFNIAVEAQAVATCDADFGTVVLPNGFNPFVCAGGTNQPISVSGAATGAYGTVFALTSVPDLTIQAINLDGSSVFDFSALPAGEYLIHAFNFQLDQASTILAAVQVGVTTGFDVAALIADGTICAELDVQGTAIHHLTPIQVNVDEGCDEGTSEVILTVTITGGLPEYDNTFSYTSEGQVSGSIAYGQTIQSTVPDDSNYNYSITDDNGCQALASGNATCSKCDNEAGTMGAATLDCEQNIVTATATGFVLADSSILVYYLHTSATEELGTVIATDANGSFDLSSLAPGTYYISSVAGYDHDEDGTIDNLNDECTLISVGTPVSWGGPVVLTVSEDCDDATSEYILTVSASGGTGTYTLSGTFNQTLTAGETLTQNFPDDTPYQILLTDGNGCIATAEGQPTCSKCDNDAGTMPLDPTGNPCGSTFGATTTDAVVAPGAILIYALHTSPDTTAGTIIATNTTGQFSFASLAPGTYYISAVVGTDEDGDGSIDDLADFCTKVAAGTRVDWNDPLSATWVKVCNPLTKTATLTLNVEGGAAPYLINGNVFFNLEYDGSDPAPSQSDLEDATYDAFVTDANGCADTATILTDCKILSIECVSFNGEVTTQGNLLKWAVVETDNNFFTVERSTDGVNFTAIATVDGNGTTFAPTNYSYLDKEAPNGMSYYRIVGNSYSGDADFCNTINLTRGEIKFGIGALSPVPVNNYVDIVINTVNTNAVKIRVFDAIGQLVTVQTQTVIAGVNHVILNTEQLPSGMYFLTATEGASTATAKFVKE